ncbi:hypothetical protein GALMADRAFT_240023 [Galerina marginata CBS 339.88]|uniref:Uncharacterized protein n=1 Tax=Galerina marginata (strain CBS 339.88) TaxID=685588 RepID=A0A067TPG2_GALM3|nr:hypothetical protein GALMADRAFT_240023 [Galerina marginata CBS 339.88]
MDYSSGAIKSLMGAKAGNRSIVDFSRLTALNSLDKTGHMVVIALLDLSTCLESITCTVWDTFSQPFRNILNPNTLKTLKTFSATIVIPPCGVAQSSVTGRPGFDASHSHKHRKR